MQYPRMRTAGVAARYSSFFSSIARQGQALAYTCKQQGMAVFATVELYAKTTCILDCAGNDSVAL